MVGPVNSSSGFSAPLRAPQASSINQASNRQVAQAVLNKTPVNAKSGGALQLAAANSQPPANLPRGSIVDKLV